MKILCLCSAGAKRSNYLAFVLKGYGHDALAAGVDLNTPDTVAFLSDWAERIVVAEPFMANKVPERNRPKIYQTVLLGPDIWPDHNPDELKQRCHIAAQQITQGAI